MGMEQTELRELIARCLGGDPQAQEALVKAVQGQVFYHCRRLLGHEEDAQDACQDVLIAMLQGLSTLREPAAFWGWLNQITARLCGKRLSRQKRARQRLEEALMGVLPGRYAELDDQTIPDRRLDNEENRRMIWELVDALPAAQRLCVLLYYYDEMSVRDIADALEISEGTVKSRLYYARRHIRRGVERHAQQGFRLYGLSPLPFLRYFLQREAPGRTSGGALAAVSGAAACAAAGTALSAGGGAGLLSLGSPAVRGAAIQIGRAHV